jgi:ketosteroid isomerase-like protein
MTGANDAVTDSVVRALIDAINAGDRDAFFALLTDDATMSDDGSERDLGEWVDREIFGPNGRMEVESATDGGRSLIASFRNDTWGAMRTTWSFTVDGDRISRFDTGQAPRG